jgi:hypothetical protein
MQESKGKLPTDPTVLMATALGRDAAANQLYAVHKAVDSARVLVEKWDKLSKLANLDDKTALVRWLSHEQPKEHHGLALEIHNLIWHIQCISDNYQEYKQNEKTQSQMNGARLAMMQDVDFPGGEYWEKLLAECNETAILSEKKVR